MGQSQSGQLQIVGESGADPLTRSRETTLWDQATAYASAKQRPTGAYGPSVRDPVTGVWRQGEPIMGMENPFSEQYGRASSMPAMSAMTGAGQEYLTRSILGPGQYDLQNLGFTDYVRPESAAQSTEQQLAEIAKQRLAREEDQAARRAVREAQLAAGAEWTDEDEKQFWKTYPSLQGMQVSERGSGSLASTVGAFGGGTTRDTSGLLGSRAAEERYRSGMGLDDAGNLVQMYDPRPYSPTVGIREIEEGGDVTRRMLRQGEPDTPGYKQFLSGGWTKQDEAGIGETPGFERDADGNLVPITGFGFTGAQLEGPTYDAAGKLVTPGYRPGYDAIRGQVTGEGDAATRATPFGVEERDPFTFGSIDPATGQPRVDPETGFPIGDVPAVTQRFISEQTGYGIEGAGQRIARNAAGDPIRDAAGELVMESALPMTEAQRTLSQIGQAARPGQVYDPTTGEYTTAAVAERIGEQSIAGLGQFMDPATGELRDVMTPGEFGGASFLGGPAGGPAIQDYMNVAGVEAQVAQAQEDYQRQLNALQAQQAATGAFGVRSELEDLGALEAQERNIAQIRGAGFDRAAQMMEADVGRRQQAGLQEQELLFEGGSQAQRLGQQANIREAELGLEAAQANQATALASGSQTQQIQADKQMRQAELNLQRMQGTQALAVESGMQQAGFGQEAAVRQTELDLEREQATQGLGAEAFMQQRELGQQAAIASASNALAAAQSDQEAALASGNQAAALEAARRAQSAQAQIDIAMQTQFLGADAAGQQAALEAARLQRLSEMGLQAGGMGLDAQAEFRQQQLAAAQQLANIGGMRQDATFGAGGQLAGMGARQEQAQMMQQAWDYEQWLRGQEGFAPLMAFRQGMMPGGSMQEFARKPSKFGQILGAATSLGGAYLAAGGGRGRGGGVTE